MIQDYPLTNHRLAGGVYELPVTYLPEGTTLADPTARVYYQSVRPDNDVSAAVLGGVMLGDGPAILVRINPAEGDAKPSGQYWIEVTAQASTGLPVAGTVPLIVHD